MDSRIALATHHVSPGVPNLRMIIAHHAYALRNLLLICIHPREFMSYQEICHWNQVAEEYLQSLLPPHKPAIFVRHQVRK